MTRILLEAIKKINPHIKIVAENVPLKKLYITWSCGHLSDSIKYSNFNGTQALIDFIKAMQCSECEAEFRDVAEMLRLEHMKMEKKDAQDIDPRD